MSGPPADVDSRPTLAFARDVGILRSTLISAALALPLASAPVTAAERLTERQVHQAEAFASNNSLFFLYHEIGHLLIDQLELPVLGREEDAADNMATYMLLRQHTPRADRILKDAAYGWLLSGDKYDAEVDTSDFYDAHSFDHQRAFQIVCLMVGSDEKTFGPVADDYGMEKDRQESCSADYGLVARSMESLLGRQWTKRQPRTKVDIRYSPTYGDYAHAARVFRESGAFETVAADLRNEFGLSKKVAFHARACGGDPNAYYEPETLEVIYCYELMDDLLSLFAAQLPEDTVSNDHVGRTGSMMVE